MELKKAREIGMAVLEEMQPYLIKGEIVGSIRRQKEIVKDIDFVILLKDEFMTKQNLLLTLKSLGEILMRGKEIVRIDHKEGIKLDIYIANKSNYEIIKLIRTGSAQHNIKIATEAKKQGKRLNFEKGLINESTGKVIATSEKDIFLSLRIPYVEPNKRD